MAVVVLAIPGDLLRTRLGDQRRRRIVAEHAGREMPHHDRSGRIDDRYFHIGESI